MRWLVEYETAAPSTTPCGESIPAGWHGLGAPVIGHEVSAGMDGVRPVYEEARANDIAFQWLDGNPGVVVRVRTREVGAWWALGQHEKVKPTSSLMKPREIIDTWLHGCGNTIPFDHPPWHCGECTSAMLVALMKSVAEKGWTAE